MSFILKSEPTVINIKLTDTGRQLLSQGRLTFSKFSVGDSEIDYSFSNEIGSSPFDSNTLRPKDNNPQILSYLQRSADVTGDTYQYDLPTSIVADQTIIINDAKDRGFFKESGGNYEFLTDVSITKQANMMIDIGSVTGGSRLEIQQDFLYGSNPNEPIPGDYLMVVWANPQLTGGTLGYDIDTNTPYLWYKILEVEGTLQANTLVVQVDRELPTFSASAAGIKSQALLYPNSNNREVSGDSIQNYYGQPFVTDFLTEAYLSFIDNCNKSDLDVPVWNLSIVYTKTIAGIGVDDKNLDTFYTKQYGGFVSYIQEQSKTIDNLGIIHFTNKSPNNDYGEGLTQTTPKLILPTLMWHKNSQIGLTLTADTQVFFLPETRLRYQNLVDENGNILGKVFLDLKVFVIEDQELLFAMSYKTNRSWSLPQPIANFNIVRDC